MGLLMNEFTTALLFSRGCEDDDDDDDTTAVIFPVVFTAPLVKPPLIFQYVDETLRQKSLSIDGYIILLFTISF